VTADETGKPLSRITWTGPIRNGLDYLLSEGYVDTSNPRTKRAYEALKDPKVDGLLDAVNIVSSQMKQYYQFPTWLESVFGSLSQETRHPALLDVLKALHDRGATLLTTNYDDVLERYCGLQHIGRSNKEDVSRFQRGDLDGVFHIHGSFHNPPEVVLDTTDYYKVKIPDIVQDILKTLLQYKSILFIGCGSGLEDPNFDVLLRWASVREINYSHRHCFLVRDGDIVNYEPWIRVNYGPDYKDLVRYLQRLLEDQTDTQSQAASDDSGSTKGKKQASLQQQGKCTKAKAIDRQTLELRQTVLGKDHPDTLTSMSNLALSLHFQSKYDEAAIRRQALQIRQAAQAVLWKDHPDALTSMMSPHPRFTNWTSTQRRIWAIQIWHAEVTNGNRKKRRSCLRFPKRTKKRLSLQL
jgi:hypothetical protein